jgi:uncharacterized OsmC-like protein
MPATTTTMLNGWNLEQVGAELATLAQNPAHGALTWRGQVHWDGGFAAGYTATAIEQQDHTVHRDCRIRIDHPPELSGRDTGIAAVELLMASLASCLAGTYAVQATARGIELRSLDIQLQARTDMAAFLGLRDDVRPGIQQITATVTIGTDADDQALAEITQAVTRLSDIYDTIANPVPIDLHVDRTPVADHPDTGGQDS